MSDRFSVFGTAPSPPDERDHSIRAYGVNPALSSSLPDTVGQQWIDSYPGIRDQAFEGSCTGFALRGVKGAQERAQRQPPPSRARRVPDFGPRGIYVLAKREGGYEEEEGAYMRDVLKAADHFGVPREADWPYVPHTDAKGSHDIGEPKKRWLTNAKRWQIGSYARLSTLEEIRVSLHSVSPIFMAMNLTESFFTPSADGMVPPPSGSAQGSHAMCFLAHSRERRAFFTANSWGSDWGLDGFCWIGEDHFLGAQSEAWAIPDYV